MPLIYKLVAPGLRYGYFLIFLIWLQVDACIKMTKGPYLSPEAPNLTIKVEEKKVPFFWIWDLWAEIWPFCHFYDCEDLEPNQENEKMATN